jgi:hypothetical protein
LNANQHHPHRGVFDIVLVVAAVVALTLAVYFRLRYGDVYRIGDGEYRRVGVSDQLAYVLPAAIFALSVGLLGLRRLCGGSITMQWKREQDVLRSARAGEERAG